MSKSDQIALALDQIGRIARELQYSHNLNPAQWEALRYVARANKFSRTPGALADFLGATKGTVSQTLIALESKGLLIRKRCEQDGRMTRLLLTEAGNNLIGKDPLNVVSDYTSSLPPAEKFQLLETLQNLLSTMRKNSRAEVFGYCAKCQSFNPCKSDDTPINDMCDFQKEPLRDQDLEQICNNFTAQPR